LFSELWNSFIIAAESNSLTEASQKLFISHTALIKRINAIESQLGFTLFIRSTQGIRLTAAGELFYCSIKDISKKTEQCISAARRLAEGEKHETLRVGYTNDCQCDYFDIIYKSFIEQFPDIKLYFTTTSSGGGKDLLDEKLDIVNTLFAGFRITGLSFQKLSETNVKCFLPPSHPLAVKDCLTLNDINGYPLALFPSHFSVEQKALWTLLERHCPDSLLAAVESSSYLPAYLLFGKRILIAFYANTRLSQFVSIPLECSLMASFGLLYKSNPSPLVKKYLEIAKKIQPPEKVKGKAESALF